MSDETPEETPRPGGRSAPQQMPDPQMDAVRASADTIRATIAVLRAASAGDSKPITGLMLDSIEKGLDALVSVVTANRFNSALVMNALRSARPAREPSSGMPPVFGSSLTQESDHGNGTGNTSGDATGDALANIVSRLE